MWLRDVGRWQGECLAALADLEQVYTLIIESGDALRKHATMLNGMIAEHEAMTEGYEVLKAKHRQTRCMHEQTAERHDGVMRRVRAVAKAIREVFCARPAASPRSRPATETGFQAAVK